MRHTQGKQALHAERMAWWQTLLIATIPVLITGLSTAISLKIQSRANSALEIARIKDRADERDHQANLAAQQKSHERDLAEDQRVAEAKQKDLDRQREMDTRWHADRVSAHNAFLDAIDPAIEKLSARTWLIGLSDEDDNERITKAPTRPDISEDAWKRVEVARTTLLRVATDEASEAADLLYHIVSSHRLTLNIVELIEVTSKDIRRGNERISTARNTYLRAMRKDLGTGA